MQPPLTSLSLLAALTLSLTGCPNSPCTGEFISQNESCAPGCPGVRVGRFPSTPCAGDGVEMIWCIPPTGTADVNLCILDEDTDTAYAIGTNHDLQPTLTNVRYCTDEENRSRRICSNP